MPLVHEGAGRRAGSSVQVLVRAPGGEVDVPVVQRERQVADRMREIESGNRANAMRGFRKRPDVEPLTSQVLDTRQQDEREPLADGVRSRRRGPPVRRRCSPARGATWTQDDAGSRPCQRSCDTTA